MAMTQQDLDSIEKIVDRSVLNLEKLFIEKLNGHGENTERHSKQIDQLYTLDRERVSEIAVIRADIIRIEGKVNSHSELSKYEQVAHDKKESAIETVQDKFTAKNQFSVTTWVAIACAIAGPIIVAMILGGLE